VDAGWLVGLVGGYWLVSGSRFVDTGWLVGLVGGYWLVSGPGWWLLAS
jgi:hypothetical protein